MPSSPLGFFRKGSEADIPSAFMRMTLRVVKAATLERRVVRRRTAYIMLTSGEDFGYLTWTG